MTVYVTCNTPHKGNQQVGYIINLVPRKYGIYKPVCKSKNRWVWESRVILRLASDLIVACVVVGPPV